MYGVAFMQLSGLCVEQWDRLQRKIGRMILHHSSRGPTPSVLAFLSWLLPWSHERVSFEQIGLLSKLLLGSCVPTHRVIEPSALCNDSWVACNADTWAGVVQASRTLVR